jgi:hypothetical protein
MMSTIRFLGLGWAATAVVLLYVLLFAGSNGERAGDRHPADPASDAALVPVRAVHDDQSIRSQPARTSVEPTSADPEDATQSEAYQRALARVTLPEPTGDAEKDRRNVLRHWLQHSGFYEPGSFSGPVWELTRLRDDPRINPTNRELTSDQIGEVAKLVAGDSEERRALWSRRLGLEGKAIAAAIDAGSFDWFGPTAPHQDQTLGPMGQQRAFQLRMNETWGEMGLGWTCMMSDVRGVPYVVYATPRSAPELFDAIRACVDQERAGLEAARRYVESLGH